MAGRFIVRAWGYDYHREPVRQLGYATKDSGVVDDVRRAISFDNEADAWTFLTSSDLYGHDKDGEWAWVEALDN